MWKTMPRRQGMHPFYMEKGKLLLERQGTPRKIRRPKQKRRRYLWLHSRTGLIISLYNALVNSIANHLISYRLQLLIGNFFVGIFCGKNNHITVFKPRSSWKNRDREELKFWVQPFLFVHTVCQYPFEIKVIMNEWILFMTFWDSRKSRKVLTDIK